MNGVPLALGAVGALALLGAARRGSRAETKTLYHLTERAKFKLDPRHMPADNSISIEDRSGRAGIYLTSNVEPWLNRFGYWRPFVVELHADPSVVDDPGVHGRWGGELFIPAASFGKLTVNRVLPLDAHAREVYRDHGWIEQTLGIAFDTRKPITTKPWERPFQDYRYPGPDVRVMPAEDVKRLKDDLRRGAKIRRGG